MIKFKAKFKSEYNKISDKFINNKISTQEISKENKQLFKVKYTHDIKLNYNINSERNRKKNEKYKKVAEIK